MKDPLAGITGFIAGILLSGCSFEASNEDRHAPDDTRLVRLYYENSGGENAVTHFYYDPEGKNYLAVWHLADSSRSSVNRHTLDSAGRLLVKSRTFSDGITSVQRFSYDSEGRLILEDFNRSDRVSGEVDYYYGTNGKLLYADCKGLNGWFFGRINYRWEGDLKAGAVLMRDSVRIGTIRYDYEEGRLVREFWDFRGEWSQTFRYEYQQASPVTFASSNVFIREDPWFKVRSEYYDFNGESGGLSHYTYGMKGKLTRKEFIRSDGLSTITTYEYDSTGLLERSLREYADGLQTEFLYWYSVDRKLLVKTFSWTDGREGSETYRYDGGKLVRGEYVNVDGWLNGVLTFEYGDYDLLISALFEGYDGFDAGLEFTYDRNFNLQRIHWKLSSGHTQTYYFTYEPS